MTISWMSCCLNSPAAAFGDIQEVFASRRCWSCLTKLNTAHRHGNRWWLVELWPSGRRWLFLSFQQLAEECTLQCCQELCILEKECLP